MRKTLFTLQEFSVPLIAGVVVAMLAANWDADLYHGLTQTPLTQMWAFLTHGGSAHHGHAEGWGHYLTLHFLANDIFMALFFGIAAKEITEACLPNGALNPPRKAVNPLFGTIGGVVGPIGVFLSLNALFGMSAWRNGWGIPTATDIALAWLVARLLFGKGHPAVSFLLLLAVADDAIGLGIIAVGYPDPAHPTEWGNLIWMLPGMAIAYSLRVRQVQSWVPYLTLGGAFCWGGLYSAHLHPALALVFVVPFLPPPNRDEGLYESVDFEELECSTTHADRHCSPLEQFEHDTKTFVDFGLFFFAFANAGVALSEITGLTWILLSSLLIGKTVGIFGFSWIATRLGFPLPTGMSFRHLFVTGIIAGLGLTVALFVSNQAFTTPSLQGAAKMGAVFSIGSALFAFIAFDWLGLREGDTLLSLLLSRIQSGLRRPTEKPTPALTGSADV
ncbi:MAG: Na+/H+ antiporter NhaA [Planctomycetaceae bacterium]|nr:Na+/H+ antiporter NhaA [Planctomycetaceae bacterium]